MTFLPDWDLVICGEGPDRSAVESLARKAGVADRVRFLGRVPQQELFDLLASEVDVFLYPSLHDDSPLGVAEALSCGVPVVCLDRGGPALITGDAGIAVPPGGSTKAVVARLARAVEQVRVSDADIAAAVARLSLEGKYEELRKVTRARLPVVAAGDSE
jgi:glycosyltransferase involved in cell wall biosynthesis